MKGKSTEIIIFLIILLLYGGIIYLFIYYNNKVDEPVVIDESQTTTTTTTTTTAVKDINSRLMTFNTVGDYVTAATKLTKQSETLVSDGSYQVLDFEMENRCKNDNDKITFNNNQYNISYTCVEDAEHDNSWEGTVNIDNKYSIKDSTFTTCGSWYYYFNKNIENYYVYTYSICSTGSPHIVTIYDKSGNKKLNVDFQEYLWYDMNSDKIDHAPIIIKNNILYYIEADSKAFDTKSACRIKYVDLEADDIKPVDSGTSIPCVYADGS